MARKITGMLISLFHLDTGDKKKNYGYFAGGVSILINLLIFGIKFFFGVAVNSIALVADAIHSLSDVATSLIVVIGFGISAKPPDREHPFGHGRVERIVSIVIACMLIVVGIEFFINGINRLQNPVSVESRWIIVVMLLVTIIAKIVLSIITFDLGKLIGSLALKADAWHHSTDAISTVLVIVGFILYRFGLYYVDGIVAIIIALFIAYTGISIIFESGSILVGEAPSLEFTERIKNLALACGGVTDVHHIHVHDYGGTIEVTVHVRLRADMHLDAAHAKATEVEQCIKDNIKGVEVTVHAEPAR
ncbi:MAG: cation diffusion facilitator family transporter [bacterium]